MTAPVTLAWTAVVASGVPAARESHCCAAIGSLFYVFGGAGADSSQLGDLSCYNPATGSWSAVVGHGDAPPPLTGAAMCALDQRLVIFGGLSNERGWLNDTYVLDTRTLQWTRVVAQGAAGVPAPRDKAAVAAFDDGQHMLLFGGFGPQEPPADEEATIGNTANADGHGNDHDDDGDDDDDDDDDDEEGADAHGDVTAMDEDERGAAATFGWFNDVHVLDGHTLQWRRVATSAAVGAPASSVPTPRAACGLAVVPALRSALVFGGRDSTGRVGDSFLLNLDLHRWTRVGLHGSQPSGRVFPVLLPVPGVARVLMFGGINADEEALNDSRVLCLSSDTWFRPNLTNSPPPRRTAAGAVSVTGTAYIFGGSQLGDINAYTTAHGALPTVPSNELYTVELVGIAAAAEPVLPPSSTLAASAASMTPIPVWSTSGGSGPAPTSAPSSGAVAPCPAPSANCVCGGPPTFRCSRCAKAQYCSAACQRGDWKNHKLVCSP